MPNVLILETHDELLDNLKSAFEYANFNVRVSSTGSGAIQELHASLPDIFILDTNITDVDSDEVIRLLRQLDTAGQVYIVLTTCDSLMERTDADVTLLKPFSTTQLTKITASFYREENSQNLR